MDIKDKDLEYVEVVAKRYCLDENYEKGEMEDCDLLNIATQDACSVFSTRYPQIMEKMSNLKEIYYSEPSMQEKLKTYDLDADKFWLLLSFLRDFIDSGFNSQIESKKETLGDTLEKMIKTLSEKGTSLAVLNDINYPVASTRNIWIKNIVSSCLEEWKNNNPMFLNLTPIESIKSEGLKYYRWKSFLDKLKYFLHTISKYNAAGKEDWRFIAQCLYMTGLADEESFRSSDIANSETGIGKKIKDNVKKYRDLFDTNLSLYITHASEYDTNE